MAKRNTTEKTEQTPEAAEPTEPTEGTEPEASTESAQAPAAEAQAETPKEDPVPALVSAIDAALSGASEDGSLSDELKANLQTAYRKVPAARRGAIQAEIFSAKMAQVQSGEINTAALAAILEEMVKAPAKAKGTGTRKATPALPPEQLAAQTLIVLQLATQTVLADLESDEQREAARNTAKEALANAVADVPEEQVNAMLDRVRKTVKTATTKVRSSGGSGGGGDRTSLTDDLAKLIERGDIKVGDVIFHGKEGEDRVEATIAEGGKVAVAGLEGSPFNSPSSAASAVLKSQNKATSVNGWAFWMVQQGDKAVQLGSLRKA